LCHFGRDGANTFTCILGDDLGASSSLVTEKGDSNDGNQFICICVKAVEALSQFPSQQQQETKKHEGQKRTFFIRLSKPSPKSGIAKPVAQLSTKTLSHQHTRQKKKRKKNEISFVRLWCATESSSLAH
jgi:hypothetical protein